MKKMIFVALVTAVFSSGTAANAQVASEPTGKVVGPGVTWFTEFNPEGPLNWNVMRVEVENPHVTLETESGKDRLFVGEKVHDSVKREEEPGRTEIIGGVNADFWVMSPRPYTPIGLSVADGMIYNMPSPRRSAFVFTEDEVPYIGNVTLDVTLKADGKSLTVDRINSVPKNDKEIILFTPPYGDTVEATKGKRYLVKMDGNEFLPNQPVEVILTETDSGSETSLTDSLILHVPEGRVSDLPEIVDGEQMTLLADLPQVKGTVRSVCGGGPAILLEGEVQSETEDFGSDFYQTKHPRTALGISRDKKVVYLVTVDGRQPRISVGAALDELGRYMLELGCYDAINLDGGGSTSMVVNDKVVNKPSDFRGPRTVANALLVVATAATSEPESLSFTPSGKPLVVPAGAKVNLEISAMDENSVPLELENYNDLRAEKSELVKSVQITDSKAVVEFTETPGTGKLKFTLGDAVGELEASVVKLEEVTVEPDVVVLGTGDSVAFHVGAKANGKKIELTDGMVEVISSDEGIANLEAGKIVASGKGESRLDVKIGTSTTEVPVYVGLAEGRTLEGFEAVTDIGALDGTAFNEAATTVSVETEKVKEGKASARVDYKMNRGGRSRINVPLSVELTDKPAGLGLWVYGDGQEAWVRAYLTDNNGTTFIAAFTEGADGITWKDEWRHLMVPYQSLIGTDFEKSPRPALPMKVEHISLIQDQEALKRSGSILLDGLEALYAPSN